MFPHFICIGAYKSGTTWLYKNLKEHPEVWLPPVKELKYLSETHRAPWFFSLLASPEGRIKLRRKTKTALGHIKRGQHIDWYLRYFFQPHNDDWYASLFSPSKNQIAGDIDAGYDIIDQKKIAHIHALMPDRKIIYLIRNPIERMCSHACMSFVKRNNQKIDHIDPKTIKAFFDKEEFVKRSQYVENIKRWKIHYSSEQIFIAFFEQLKQDPIQLFKDICQFLEIDDEYIPNHLKENANKGSYSSVPEDWARYLAQKYYGSIQSIDQEFDNQWTAQWLDYAEKNLEETNPLEASEKRH